MDSGFKIQRLLTIIFITCVIYSNTQNVAPSSSFWNSRDVEIFQKNSEIVFKNRNPIYDFATNLYLSVSKLRRANENMLISPFSIRAITALIYLASRGETAQEIRKALLFPENHQELIEGLAKHMTSTKNVKNSKFDVGNGIFLREGVFLNRTYSDIVQQKLYSTVNKCNFNDPRIAGNLINTWVANITKDRIKRIVNPNNLNPRTSIFMANALYFSGAWNKPFDETSTTSGVFTLESGVKSSVPMMQIENSFNYNYIPELKATGISLPFQDNRFEFIILKPDENLAQLEYNLEEYPLNLISVEIKKQTRNVLLRMPKFQMDVNYDLVDVMRILGINSLFNASSADVSGLSKVGDKHHVSQIVHQTVLDVNEKGAAAAAATTISFYPISSPSFFTLDKPFLFLLNDRYTGPVFIGRLANPNLAKIRH